MTAFVFKKSVRFVRRVLAFQKEIVSKLASIPSDNRPCDVMCVRKGLAGLRKPSSSHFIHSYRIRISKLMVRLLSIVLVLSCLHIILPLIDFLLQFSKDYSCWSLTLFMFRDL